MQRSLINLDIEFLFIQGDIAEMAVYQGPLVGSKMAIGATGFWNSTMQPRIFYLTDHNGHLDATRAEILGGIDGAKNLKFFPNILI